MTHTRLVSVLLAMSIVVALVAIGTAAYALDHDDLQLRLLAASCWTLGLVTLPMVPRGAFLRHAPRIDVQSAAREIAHGAGLSFGEEHLSFWRATMAVVLRY